MTKSLFVLALVATLTSTAARAQDKPAAAPVAAKPTPPPTVPLRVQIVISRYQGEKKISSMPYTLSVNAGANGTNRASIRMGAQVPVMMMMMAAPVVEGQKVPTAGPIQYKDVGTNIDCDAQAIEDGRFRIQVNVDDSSVYPDDQKRDLVTSGSPSFRSFRATDSMMLRDGATSQFTAAVDKVSGETVKIDVTLTVVK